MAGRSRGERVLVPAGPSREGEMYSVASELEDAEWSVTAVLRVERTADVSSVLRQLLVKARAPHVTQSRVGCELIRPGEYSVRMSVDAVDAYAALTKMTAVIRSALAALSLSTSVNARITRMMADEVVHRS